MVPLPPRLRRCGVESVRGRLTPVRPQRYNSPMVPLRAAVLGRSTRPCPGSSGWVALEVITARPANTTVGSERTASDDGRPSRKIHIRSLQTVAPGRANDLAKVFDLATFNELAALFYVDSSLHSLLFRPLGRWMMKLGWKRHSFDRFASKKTPLRESAAVVAIKVYCEPSATALAKSQLACGELRRETNLLVSRLSMALWRRWWQYAVAYQLHVPQRAFQVDSLPS